MKFKYQSKRYSVAAVVSQVSVAAISLLLSTASGVMSQELRANDDESKILQYEVPDPLLNEDGIKITAASDWSTRRAEILELFENHVFGKMPSSRRVESRIVRRDPTVNQGKTIRYELTVTVKSPAEEPRSKQASEENKVAIQVLVDVPSASPTPSAAEANAAEPVPDPREAFPIRTGGFAAIDRTPHQSHCLCVGETSR